jgi:hypothetical protein
MARALIEEEEELNFAGKGKKAHAEEAVEQRKGKPILPACAIMWINRQSRFGILA